MVKRLATSRHNPLGITDSACKNQLVVVSVQYGSFNTYIPIRSTTIGKSRVARDPIAMHTSWRSNSDIASVTRLLKIDQDEARLAAQGCTWYEIKASTLRESDISFVKDKAGISERGLRFPIPKFITSLCDHLEFSPSQLNPNSFRSLLSLGILLKFFRIPISTYTLMRLIQIKRLGPGKFYISNKCLSGNPSSHKGWMSRYFFIKCISSRENSWGCNMSWRDNADTLLPPAPEQAPDLTHFLEVREKCFNAHELIEENLLCYFRISWKKVQLVGDLGERMLKAEMMKALKEKKADPEGTSLSLSKVSGGRTSEPKVMEGKTPEQQTTEAPYVLLDTSAISFVANPSGSVSLDFTRRLVHDQDFDLVKSVPDLAALEAASLHFMQALVWNGEVANRLLRARDEVTMTRHSMYGMLTRHDGLMKQLEEMRAISDKEKESMLLELETSRAQALHLEEENNALHTEVEKLKGEAENSWELGKEKFLQSKELKIQCSGKALAFFEKGFDGCLAQFRANGYSEEEHPAPFLDVERSC
ncbi:hypothetical protein F511_21068 [Dorcoceras hygrometricum]|uniref:Uncharacterized protein n=1 Tax=Dorcoceras hygrometricum TaxID=472368 RepID=A0A2Z7CJ21_9LAMI|nr:hypothetical protein F511_21068 [Dorcoceras hygrometricum]